MWYHLASSIDQPSQCHESLTTHDCLPAWASLPNHRLRTSRCQVYYLDHHLHTGYLACQYLLVSYPWILVSYPVHHLEVQYLRTYIDWQALLTNHLAHQHYLGKASSNLQHLLLWLVLHKHYSYLCCFDLKNLFKANRYLLETSLRCSDKDSPLVCYPTHLGSSASFCKMNSC